MVGIAVGTMAVVAGSLLVDIEIGAQGEGTFTTAQAERGATVYTQACASCHGATLTGGTAPPLIGQAFEASWSHPRVTLDDIFFLQRTTMPPRAAATVSPEDHAAVFAYLLQRNGYTSGPVGVSPDAAQLRQVPRWVSATSRRTEATAPAFVSGAPGARPAEHGPTQVTLNQAGSSTDWLLHRHDYAGTRFSRLDQITATNADRLAPVCSFELPGAANFQTGPIVHAGTMFVTTSNQTVALDASTCQEKWRHQWAPRGNPGWWRNRGVAIKDGRLLRGTPDGYLLALNAATGELLWARRVAISEAGETFSMPPLVFEDLVIIGPAGSENNIQGWVGAFRLDDGAPVWRFNTVPRPGDAGHETWQNPQGIPTGGGAVWTPFSLDPSSGELYIAAANPAPDLPVHLRRGDNLYTNALICLDVRTGRRLWHHSLVPGDSHDWDLTHAGPLLSTTVQGAVRRIVVTAGKDGFLRALDRDTHVVLYETPVTTIENAAVPITTTPTRACPGVLGGVQWSAPAYSPATNMLYVPAVDWCSTFTAFQEARYIPGKNYLGGTAEMDPPAQAQGWLTGVDAATGQVRWRYRSARPMVAAVTATAGNLLLTGEITGDVLALDATTGAVRWRFATRNPIGGGIVTYAAAGRQLVAVASGSPSNFWTTPDGQGTPTITVFGLR